MPTLTDFRDRLRLDLKDSEKSTFFIKTIDECDNGWVTADANHITVDHDAVDFQEPLYSARLICDATTVAGDLAYKNFNQMDLTSYSQVVLWLKSNHSYDANDLMLILSNAQNIGFYTKTLYLPGQQANIWVRIILDIGDASGLGAIVSVGLSSSTAQTDRTIHIDDIIARRREYRWSDETLNRHIQHALADYSLSSPIEKEQEIATVDDSPEIDLSSIADLLIPYAVEFPIHTNYPVDARTYRRFAYFNKKLRFLEINGDGTNAKLYYGASHTIDAASSTVPSQHENIILLGASAYALLEYAAYSIGQDNLDDKTPKYYLDRGSYSLDQFHQKLLSISRKSRLQSRRLFTKK